MKNTLFFLFAFIVRSVAAQEVGISYDRDSPQAGYAARQLQEVLEKNGYTVSHEKKVYEIQMRIVPELGAESFRLVREGRNIGISGGDGRGLIYGALSVVSDVRNGMKLEAVSPRDEKPKLQFRGIKYDLPWDTYRHSYSLDQHQETCSEVAYWEAFLDMMSENRFNTLTLWNLHPYTFMIKPENFPEASPWNDQEMAEWKNLFGSIFKMASERGIDTYVIPFNIFVTPEFAKAHNVAMDNLDHHFFVRGDTSEIVKRYTRECVTQLLNEYPELSGMGLTLGREWEG